MVRALKRGVRPRPREQIDELKIDDPHLAIKSADDIERALGLSFFVQRDICSRDELWQFTLDKSPVVRKIAVSALDKPLNGEERAAYWKRLSEESDGGVRGWYAYGLVQEAGEDEIAVWISSSTDPNWTVRWCVSEYLSKYPDKFPQLEKTHDPDSIQTNALPVLRWLEKQGL